MLQCFKNDQLKFSVNILNIKIKINIKAYIIYQIYADKNSKSFI